jgi:flagellin
MSRINNLNSLIAQRFLAQQNKGLTKSLERLSTGLRINRGSDDPAGLIASEKLRSNIAKIEGAVSNAERAEQVVNIAEGGLTEISSLLVELQSLVSEAGSEAGLSNEEKEANQTQIDGIIQTIDRIASTTSFSGVKLLNGTYDFQISAGSLDNRVGDFQINAAKLGSTSKTVNVIVTQSAQHAGLFLSTGGTLDLNNSAAHRLVIEVAGTDGAREFSFASGTTLNDIRDSFNSFTALTGVSATTSSTGIVLKSTSLGSDQFVSVDVIDDGEINTPVGAAGVYLLSSNDENVARAAADNTDFDSVTSPIRDEGLDVGAVVNGVTARGRGDEISVNNDNLDLKITLSSEGNGAQILESFTAFRITGGGAKFNLGPTVNIANEVRLGIFNVAGRNLGKFGTGFLDDLAAGQTANIVDGDTALAQEVVDAAIDQITLLRGRLGAFQKFTVGTTITSLGIELENTKGAESLIRDTDFAKETAELTRRQVLVAAASNSLNLANAQTQNVLRLLQ